MAETELQIVSNEAGEPTVSHRANRSLEEISSERETAYLLKSEPMRRRLQEALERQDGVALDETLAKLGL
ncbi:MAG: hypothetical protein JNK48_10875 [Bryobacterales bacterium]|nr:hypothetical protein [Bryobacterales bacterium]